MVAALVVGVLAVLTIAAATAIGPRFGVAAPLILVVVGILVSLLPFVPAVTIEPDWILAGVLPPLLYSASVSMPSMNFRREFGAIGGLSVLLVIISSVVLGLFFAWVLPGVGLAGGIALGAIVSPTDAVAAGIVKRAGVSPRVVAILEGESLLNDATALVLFRAAIAAAATSFAFGAVAWSFVYSVVVAVALGWAVGRLNLVVRARVSDATVNTVISFTVPFIASLPAEAIGASGMVAAVVAGLVTGRRAPRVLSPEHRLSDVQNWRTGEMVLEGFVFLTMGLQLSGIVQDVEADHAGIVPAVGVAGCALLLLLAVRAGYVAPLLAVLSRRAKRNEKLRQRFTTPPKRPGHPGHGQEEPATAGKPGTAPTPPTPDLVRFATRMRRALADIDYFTVSPLGWREGAVVVWAGMRGAVTVAAAQSLPTTGIPGRSVLVLVAFLVAVGSLLLQGGTLGLLLRLVKPATPDPEIEGAERARLMELMREAAEAVPVPDPGAHGSEDWLVVKETSVARVRAQRIALLDARDDGTFSADLLSGVLGNLDAEEISIDLTDNPSSATG